MSKNTQRTLTVVGFFIAVAALLSFYDRFTDQGIYSALEFVVSEYRYVVHRVFNFLDEPLRCMAIYIAERFQIKIEVQPYWKDLFIPIWLYFASLASAARGDGRTVYKMALLFCGLILALFFSVFLTTLGVKLSPAPALATIATSAVLYELVAFALFLPLVSQTRRQSSPNFWRYLIEKPLTTITLGLLTSQVFSFAFDNAENAAAFGLVFFIFLLGLRDMILAVIFAVENRGRWEGSFRDRLFRSRSWILGSLVTATIIVATLGIAR